MDAFWLWCWRRFGRRYSWTVLAGSWLIAFSFLATAAWMVLRFEESTRYGPALAVTSLGSLSIMAAVVLPGSRSVWGRIEGWHSDGAASVLGALESTYAFARDSRRRSLLAFVVGMGLVFSGVSALRRQDRAGSVKPARIGRNARLSTSLANRLKCS